MSAAEHQQAQFVTTRWSLVLAVRETSTAESEKALVELCRRYWFPICAYVRRAGQSREDAEDLTQDFFAEFLDKGYFERADPTRGRFRSFLLTSMKNFMTMRWRRKQTGKRGGGTIHVPLDPVLADNWYVAEPAEELTPEMLYDQQWARSLVDRAHQELESYFDRRNKAVALQHIKRYLWGEDRDVPYAELAGRAQMSVSAFKSTVHRVRRKYRDLLRAEVAETVADPAEVEDELQHLLMVLIQGSRGS